jgi:hypothetical protein
MPAGRELRPEFSGKIQLGFNPSQRVHGDVINEPRSLHMDFHLYKATRADGTVYFFHHRSMKEAKAFASDAVKVIDCHSQEDAQ